MHYDLKGGKKLQIGSIDNLSDLKMSKIEYLSNENGYIYFFLI